MIHRYNDILDGFLLKGRYVYIIYRATRYQLLYLSKSGTRVLCKSAELDSTMSTDSRYEPGRN